MGAAASASQSQAAVSQAVQGLDNQTQRDANELVTALVQQVQLLSKQVERLESALSSEQLLKLEQAIAQQQPGGRREIKTEPKNGLVEKGEEANQALTGLSSPQQPSSTSNCQVMISLNCRTMTEIALSLKRYLSSRGISVWVCTEMSGGAEFRSEIVDAVDGCKVFLPLINTPWALSPECQAEFAYAYRKNLSSKDRLPHILPIVFPDLDWNKHKHVRLLLASTNALMYKEEEKEKVWVNTMLSLKKCGVVGEKIEAMAGASSLQKEVENWTPEEVEKYLQSIVLRPFKSLPSSLDGRKLRETSDDEFMEIFGLSALHVKAIREELGGGASRRGAGGDGISGVYDCMATTINDYDGNITKSNNFRVFLDKGGIASSGMVWGAGTLHDNYDNVTCVWQGTYQDGGHFEIHARYSNETEEFYTGTIDIESGTMVGKYKWFGYGRRSSGKLEASLQRVESYELPDVEEMGIDDAVLVEKRDADEE